jgi:hypothetical protein
VRLRQGRIFVGDGQESLAGVEGRGGRDLRDFETEVEELFMFRLAAVPGLLQMAEYARTMYCEYYRGKEGCG